MSEKLEFINKYAQSGDLKMCAKSFGHNYAYLRQVAVGMWRNEQILDDIITTIKERQGMEKKLSTIAESQKKEVEHA